MTHAPNSTTYLAVLDTDEPTARRIASLIAESHGDVACSAFESRGGRWRVEAHFPARPDAAGLRSLIAAADRSAARRLTIERLKPRDWVAHTLSELKPVRAGRYVVHGAHDRGAVRPHQIGIEIEAGTAFGTGHHATTRGCLLALDALARTFRPRLVLDVGTGTGVLAIAAARTFTAPVLATDIDRNAVAVARANAAANRAGARIECLHAGTLAAPRLTARAPFDLVFANILLNPLRRLAAPMARQLAPNARVVLSGLQTPQTQAALAAYRSQALVLERTIALEGWVTLVLAARSFRPR